VRTNETDEVEVLVRQFMRVLSEIDFVIPGPKMEEPISVDDIRLTIKNRVLDLRATCHDQQVFNDTELFVLFKKPGTKDDWDALEEVAG
jgi:hypothetical protein